MGVCVTRWEVEMDLLKRLFVRRIFFPQNLCRKFGGKGSGKPVDTGGNVEREWRDAPSG